MDSLLLVIGLLLLEVGRNGLHNLLGSALLIDDQSVEVTRGSELELSDILIVPLVLLDSDLFGFREPVLLSAHDLDELLQILDFLGLKNGMKVRKPCHLQKII